MSGPPAGDTEIPRSDPEGEDHSRARDVTRARGEPEQDLSGEIPIPSADETLLCHPDRLRSVRLQSQLLLEPPQWCEAYSERTMLPNSLGVSSGSGVKRAHGDSIVNDDDEQPGTRARISALIAGLHGGGITDEWLSSWYPEAHMSQKMVIEAKRKELEIFKRMTVYRVVTRESMERDEKEK